MMRKQAEAVAGVAATCLLAATGSAWVVFAGLNAVQRRVERFAWGPSIAARVVAAQEAQIRADLAAQSDEDERAQWEIRRDMAMDKLIKRTKG